MLILSRQHGDQEAQSGVLPANPLDAGGVGVSQAIAGLTEVRVRPPSHANHHGEGETVLKTGGKDDPLQQGGARGVVGVGEIKRQRCRKIDRA